MNNVTQILKSLESGESDRLSQLMDLVYDELRRIAKAKLKNERSDHTLQATALVNEAYLRLVGKDEQFDWRGRAHFFGAAAEAMRRILIESARQKNAQKRGGEFARVDLDSIDHPAACDPNKLLALNDAIDKLAREDPRKSELVKLRFFAGFTNKQAAHALDISEATADRQWKFIRAWLKVELGDAPS